MELPKPKSRSSSVSSLASRTRRERVTFNDVISGNVSEEILTASTPVPEKVYELERIESSCQTDELPMVAINPVSFLSLSPSSIAEMRQCAVSPQPTPLAEDSPLLPSNESSSLVTYSERAEIIRLRDVVSNQVKDLKSRVQLVRGRKQLKQEQMEDEKEVRTAREVRTQNVLKESSERLDETRLVLDNLVNHFQSISSRYNRRF